MRFSLKRKDLVNYQQVERIRKSLNLNKKETAELLGISRQQLHYCEKEGVVLYFRYQAMVNAIRAGLSQEYHDKLRLLDSLTLDTQPL